MPAWLRQYRRELLAGDIGAGFIVTLMLIPQGMAYALVAGLPPVAGLYASLLPALVYPLFGTSMVQSVGPMAITSLMAGTALAALAPSGSPLYGLLAALLAGMSGLLLFVCGLLRLGFLTNFLSRPVMSGFTSGAALLIAGSQLGMLLGLPRGAPLAQALHAQYLPATLLGLGCLVLLWFLRQYLTPLLRRAGLAASHADIAGKLAPVVVLIGAAALCASFAPLAGVPQVGAIPSGLPHPGLEALAVGRDFAAQLLMPAALIAFMIFLSSQSAAQTLAQKRNERIDSNRELLGLGAANLAASLTGGFPVTGSISRSAVNYSAGANTPLAGLITATLLGLLLLLPSTWLAPLALLPLPTMGALIVIAVIGMIDVETLRLAWRHDRADAAALLATAASVLVLGVQHGVIVGVLLSFATLIGRSSRPHIAVLGRVPGSEHFRNIERHAVETRPELLLLRVDAALFFANTQSVLERIEAELAQRPECRHLVLVLSAVNGIDTSGLYLLLDLNRQLATQGRQLHLAEVKGPVMDRLRASGSLLEQLSGRVFLSAQEAFAALPAARCAAH